MTDLQNPLNCTTASLLLEIGLEEVPSDVLPKTLEQMQVLAEKHLQAVTLPFSGLKVYGTPRRLILHCAQIACVQESKEEIIVGPPKRAAFDAEGKTTKAALGFAKSQGADITSLFVEDAAKLGAAAKGKKGEYLVLRKTKEGERTAKLLESLLPKILSQLSFPRAMRWNETGIAFVRPIRSIVALFEDQIVPFSFAGVSSGDRSSGHMMLCPEAFSVRHFESYRAELNQRKVLIDPKVRRDKIESELLALAKAKKGQVDLSDPGLLWDAAYTVEWPVALCGEFEAAFLEIPQEIIITAMAEHQGYFPLKNEAGALLPYFLTVSNVETENMSAIQKGNERVLRARLLDARFYFEQDRKQALSDFFTGLKQVTFQEKLGSLKEKVERMKALAAFIAKAASGTSEDIAAAERAAHLSKCDLLTGVVREFSSLQGTMGRIYALLDGEDESVASAIEAHYLPKKAGGALPETKLGCILALADKFDTLVACFAVGLIPSGSEDPYALRRQGLGVIQILLSSEALKSLSVIEIIQEAIRLLVAQGKCSDSSVVQAVSAFLKQRLDSHLSEDIRYDLREAVLCANLDKPAALVSRAAALHQFSSDPLFNPLMMAFKRAIRILPEGFEGTTDASLLKEVAEQQLHAQLIKLEEEVRPLWEAGKYIEILKTLSRLFEPLEQFFLEVMVMDKDEGIRHNRLSLLFEIQQQFKPFGDFSKIVSGETPK